MARFDNLERLNTIVKEFSEEAFEKFSRKSFGTKSLEHLEKTVRDVQNKIQQAIGIGEYVSEPTLAIFLANVELFLNVFKKVSAANDTDYFTNRAAYENALKKHYENILSNWTEFKTVLLEKVIDSDKRNKEIEELTKALKDQQLKSSEDSKEIHELRKKLEQEFQNIEGRIKDTVTKGEFLVQEDIFKKQAIAHKKMSYGWLAGIGVSIIILIWVICNIFNNFCFETNCFCINKLADYNKICDDCGQQLLTFEMIKAIMYRLLIVSLSIYILTFCIKNYNAQMHNYTINSHKQNSFAAANSLLNKMNSETLIVEAAKSIFSHQKTGYGGKENDIQNLNMISSIIDKIKPKG